jgi:hypothetical protein
MNHVVCHRTPLAGSAILRRPTVHVAQEEKPRTLCYQRPPPAAATGCLPGPSMNEAPRALVRCFEPDR